MAFEHQRTRVELLVAPVERLVDHIGEVAGDERGGPHRIEAREIGLRHVNDRAALPADRRLSKSALRRGERRGGTDHECTPMHASSLSAAFERAVCATLSLRGERSNPRQCAALDCFVASLLAMTPTPA